MIVVIALDPFFNLGRYYGERNARGEAGMAIIGLKWNFTEVIMEGSH